MITSSHSHSCPLTDTHQHIANHNTTATLNATVTLSNDCLLMLFLALSPLHPVTFSLTYYHPPVKTQIAFNLLWTSNIKCMYTVPLYAASTNSSHFKY